MKNCVKLELLGAVHSGGVRPFFWKIAAEAGLTGWVGNSDNGICLLLEGDALTSGTVGRREIPVALNVRCACALGMLINLRQAMLSAVWLDGSVISVSPEQPKNAA